LGHGVAGIALALDELAAASGEGVFSETAREAVAYERSWFDKRQRNWPDLREFDHERLRRGEGPSFPAFWCHGAVGIGLARFRRYDLTGEVASIAEAGNATATVRAHLELQTRDFAYDYTHNFSLCHGFAGSVELLLAAADHADEVAWADAEAIGDFGLEHCADAGEWPCGVRDGGETPGLMLGLAGIGMLYLRLHAPGSVPPPWWWPTTAERAAGGGSAKGILDYMNVARRERRLIAQVGIGGGDPEEVLQGLVDDEPNTHLVRVSRRGRGVIELSPGADVAGILDRWSDDERLEYAELDTVDRQATSET
jgi:hypothetical protein